MLLKAHAEPTNEERPPRRPGLEWHPLWWPIIGILFAGICGARLNGFWQSGKWTPAASGFLWLAAGLAFGAAAIIPDHLWHRGQGDAFPRRMLKRPFGLWSRSYPLWLLVFIAASSSAPYGPNTVLALGSSLGFMTWYWHWKPLWQRMWELYRAEQTNATTHGPGPALAPGD